MKTNDNLAAAFAGESQARNKYTFFAEQAEKEGHKSAAHLFRAAAEAETIHARNEFKLNGGIGSTADNLKAANAGETFEYTEMYPKMIEDAKADGNKQAEMIFGGACAAEKVHADLYNDALANLGKDDDQEYYVCPICGYIHKGKPEGPCPICKAKAEMFKKF